VYNQVKLFLLGDATRGLQYVPFAKSYLKRLHALGLDYANKALEIADVEILIKISPFVDKIFINAPATSYLSCFLDTYPILPPQKLDGNGNPIPYTPFQIGTQTIDELRYVIPPATTINPKMSFIRKVATPAIKDLTVHLPVEPGGPIPDQSLIRFREVYEKFLPSKFTGLMRGVMQIFFSYSQPTKLSQVHVDYHFGNCYGVVKNPTTKTYHLVKITADSVYYIPASFGTGTHGISPAIQDILQLMDLDNTKAVKIGTLPTDIGKSWSDELGWAFSYMDPEASIVYESSTMQGNQSYVTAELLLLTFGFDVNTGLPNSAMLTRGTPQIFWANRFMELDDDYGLFNIPRYGIPYPESGPTRLYGESFDFGPGRPYPQIRPKPIGYAVSGVPIYVYYTKTEKKICTYTYQNGQGLQLPTMGTYFFEISGETNSAYQGGDVEAVSFQNTVLVTGHDSNYFINQNTGFGVITSVVGFGNTAANALSDASSQLGIVAAVNSVTAGPGVADNLCPFADVQFTGATPTFLRYDDPTLGGILGIINLGVSAAVITEVQINKNRQQILFDTSLTLSLTDREASIIYARTVTTDFNYLATSWDGPTTKEEVNSIVSTTATRIQETMWLFGGYLPIALDTVIFGKNSFMLNKHPYPQLLDFKSTSAMFDSANVAYQTTPGSIGEPLVKFVGVEYPVENRLFGFVGVV
jgi:hypothetical protein